MKRSTYIRIPAALVATLLLSVFTALFAGEPTDDSPPGTAVIQAEETEQRARLQGRAYLGRRDNVVGATVLARPEGNASPLFLTASDARGQFRIDDLPNGNYSVEVRREGLLPVSKTGVTLKYPFRAVVELPMQSGAEAAATSPKVALGRISDSYRLQGRITEFDGEPLADVIVRLVREDGLADPRVLRSGSGGRFQVESLHGGRWSLELQGVGFLVLRTVFDLSQDAVARISMIRQPADYMPSPLELMPPEVPLPPESISAEIFDEFEEQQPDRVGTGDDPVSVEGAPEEEESAAKTPSS